MAGAFANQFPRCAMLVALDLVRAAIALCLPFVDAIWQVYVLIFVLQAASAAFTPTFQATIPDVLPDEGEYSLRGQATFWHVTHAGDGCSDGDAIEQGVTP